LRLAAAQEAVTWRDRKRRTSIEATDKGTNSAESLRQDLKIKVVVHEGEEGGYWAEVPAIPGCATQGDTFEELLTNLYEAVEGCLSVDVEEPKSGGKDHILEIAV